MNRQELGAIDDELNAVNKQIQDLEQRRRELREAYAQGHAELSGYSAGCTVRYKASNKVVKEGVVAFVRAHHTHDYAYEVVIDCADGNRMWVRGNSKNLWSVKKAGA